MDEGYDLRYAYRLTLLLASIPLLVMYTEGMLIPSLPLIQRQFGVTEANVSWILSLYLAFGTVSAALLGKLGDMYGKKKIMMIAMLVYTAGAIFTGFAQDFITLLVSRAIQGLGIAILPLAFSLIREEFPPRLIPQVQGIISSMFGIGVLISLPLGAYISQYYGWQTTYHTAIPFIILVDILAFFLVKESRYRNPQKLDLLGAFLLSLVLVPGIVGIAEGPSLGWTSYEIVILLSITSLSLITFILIERRVQNPLIPMNLISNRNIIIANFGIFLAGFIFQLISQAVVFLLETPQPLGYGLDVLFAGLWMMPNAMVQLIVAPIAGKGLIKTGIKPMAFSGALISSAGLVALSYLSFIDLPHMISGIVISSLGSTLINVSLINLVILSVDRKVLGLATGLNTVFRNMGAAWGPSIAGTIMTQFQTTLLISNEPLIEINVPSHFAYQLIFYTTASLFLILAVLVTLAKEVINEKNLNKV